MCLHPRMKGTVLDTYKRLLKWCGKAWITMNFQENKESENKLNPGGFYEEDLMLAIWPFRVFLELGMPRGKNTQGRVICRSKKFKRGF